MGPIVAALDADATIGEITGCLREGVGRPGDPFEFAAARRPDGTGHDRPRPGPPGPARPVKIVIGMLGLDQHEVGAMAISRILVRHGYDVIYLGRSTRRSGWPRPPSRRTPT